jgi:hypothetical protein
MKGGNLMVKKSVSKTIPTGVKIISILYYISAVLAVLAGIVIIFGGSLLASFFVSFAILGAGLFVIMGIIIIAVGVLGFFIGKGLWEGNPWARTVAIILAALGTLSSLSSIVGGDFGSIVSLAINVLIGWYLLSNEEVKKFFK